MITVHDKATLLEVDNPQLLADLLLLPVIANAVVERISERAVLLDPRSAAAIESALIKEGHLPQVS